jgi:hypothetical protein
MGILVGMLMIGVVVALSRLWASACDESPAETNRQNSDSPEPSR